MYSNWHRAIGASVILIGLAGCSSNRVEPISAADATWTENVQVAAIHIERNNPDVPVVVMDNLARHLRIVMDSCVVGERNVDMRVRVDNFEGNSTAAAILIGDTTGLSGTVLLEDPETGATQGEYYVDSVQSGGGLIGAAVLSGSEDGMPLMFAEQVCEDVFAGVPPERADASSPSTLSPREMELEEREAVDE
ncbi:MAG: hypothetical protein WD044_12300 [Dongiaceae bacterium]